MTTQGKYNLTRASIKTRRRFEDFQHITMLKQTITALTGAAAIGLGFTGTAQAGTFLGPGSEWEYTFADPTGDANWNTTTGGWQTGNAPFSNIGPDDNDYGTNGNFDYNTFWPADGTRGDNDLWVRTAVDLSIADLSTVTWDLGVDNAYTLYVNGVEISSDDASGFTNRWEYSGDFGGNLIQGNNIIALALDDYGVATAFDMQITGEVAVPEPASMLGLLAVGAVTAGGAVKRKVSV